MRYAMIILWLVISIAAGAHADEPDPVQPAGTEEPNVDEDEVDAEIRQIEQGVSGEDDVKEFSPTRPLSADKAIALPSDI